MGGKEKGSNAERDVVHKFWATGSWVACRVAGSGSMHYPSPDIIASNSKRRVVIECKATKASSQYLTKEEVKQLNEFAILFGAEPWIGVKFDREEWRFLRIGDLRETSANYGIGKEEAQKKGRLFASLVK